MWWAIGGVFLLQLFLLWATAKLSSSVHLLLKIEVERTKRLRGMSDAD